MQCLGDKFLQAVPSLITLLSDNVKCLRDQVVIEQSWLDITYVTRRR